MYCGSKRFGALAALAAAVALSGCSSIDLDASQAWFAKPLDMFGREGGYTFSELQETRSVRPITANDLVNADGVCAPQPAPAPSQAGPGAAPAVSPDGASVMGEGIALGMSECDVVYRAGSPSAVQLGRNPNGDRTAVLTYQSGPRPGIYRFGSGRLTDMDAVEASPPPPPRTAKKKPAKIQKPAQT